MAYKMYAAFIASLSVALTLASNETFGGSAVVRGGAATHPNFRPLAVRSLNHRNGRNVGNVFPGTGGYYWDPSTSEPSAEIPQAAPGHTSSDINYTYKPDMPWDWAHRFPPGYFTNAAAPAAPSVAYVPGCTTQTVTVPGADGKDQTVTMVRC